MALIIYVHVFTCISVLYCTNMFVCAQKGATNVTSIHITQPSNCKFFQLLEKINEQANFDQTLINIFMV